jgi:hypothetical protein
MHTLHPARPKTLAWPQQAPLAPPVMNAVRPTKSNALNLLLVLGTGG